MRRISPSRTAVAVGTVVGLWHLVWVALVGTGWAKSVLDFILELHFLKVSYSLEPYSIATAGTLIILTFTIGALFGLVFAIVWNWLTFNTAPEWERSAGREAALNQQG